MIEVAAAIVGAVVAISASSIGNFVKRDDEAAKAVVRLTVAVEHIAGEVSLLRQEIKDDRQELYPRLNAIEQRIAKLESRLQ
jgi:predicted  nucleic acid-binding Zn-ribbon protein